MDTLSDQLREEFYTWEQLGRGELVWDRRVIPEPYFLPFFGHGADLRGADFSGLRIGGLPNADARDADFSNTTWDAAQAQNGRDSIFDGASLARAQAPGIDFTNSSFRDVDFSGGDFAGAIFDRADLTGAKIDDADFTEARFVNATCPNGQLASSFGLCSDITGD